jgi:predicted phosphodiesterase
MWAAGLGLLTLAACGRPQVQPTQEATVTASPETVVIAPPPTTSLATLPAATSTPVPLVPRDLPLADVEYAIPLTLRHVTETSATLSFELRSPVGGRVFIQAEDGSAPAIERPLDPGQARFLWTAYDLQPDTLYQVVVALGPDVASAQQPAFLGRAWGPVGFRTAGGTRPLRIGVLSDASFGDDGTIKLVQQMSAADLDFVLHAGDVVDETDPGRDPFDSYAHKFFAVFEPLLTRMPVYTVPGNHDYDNDIRLDGSPFYYRAFPPFPDPSFLGQEGAERNQFYAFARNGVQFIMLDSQVLFGVPGREQQERWLAERMQDPRFGNTIAVLHVAPFSSSSVHPNDSIPVRSQWVPLFEQGDVALAISGHFHGYERSIANGITYLVAGGGSSTLYAFGDRLPESQVSARRTHFVLLELDGSQIRMATLALDGEVLDETVVPLAPTGEAPATAATP